MFSHDSFVLFRLGLLERGDFPPSCLQGGGAIEMLFVRDAEGLQGSGSRMLVLFSLLGTVIAPLLEEPS